MRQTFAMREAALDMPVMEPEALRALLSGITGQLNALGRNRSPSLQAAE